MQKRQIDIDLGFAAKEVVWCNEDRLYCLKKKKLCSMPVLKSSKRWDCFLGFNKERLPADNFSFARRMESSNPLTSTTRLPSRTWTAGSIHEANFNCSTGFF